jgi:predicted MFS family arabinose efflux permease
MPVASTIGMELAREGRPAAHGAAQRHPQPGRHPGSFLIFLGFRYLNFSFQTVFLIAALALAAAAVLLFSMQRGRPQPSTTFLKLHKEYRLYYLLAVLYGSRKQLFITFAPWVLVTIFNQPTQLIATLYTISGVIGILFQPLLGRMIDNLGERFVLSSEAVLLVFVCVGYGFSKSVFPEHTAFLIVCGCFLLDQMLMSVSMARSTFMKKIAKAPEDIQPALTAGVTIDHIFSIAVALIGGAIWNAFGFQYVFLMGAGIAVINFFTAMRVRVPKQAV